MLIPSIGSLIRLQTVWGAYTGTVVPNEKWDPPGSFCMTGDEYISVRNIMLYNVRDLEVLRGEQARKIQSGIRVFRVKNKGHEYTVTINNNKYSCTCVGFQYHRNCKHAKAVAAKVGKK